jgi:hypothetical protein
MAMQIAAKVVITIILLFLVFYVWTNQIDVQKTIVSPLTAIVKFKKNFTLDINFANVVAARFSLPENTQDGNLGLLFYDMKFVNSSAQNATVKQILLRYKFNGADRTIDSYALRTGSTLDQSRSIIVHIGPANIVLMNWKNLREAIGEYRVLPPAGVLAGSAAFILDVKDVADFAKIKSFELVAVDYSGTESTQEIPMQDRWVDMTKTMRIENRSFEIDQAGKVKIIPD